MARMPGAIWRPVSNHSPGMGVVKGMVLHHMVGSEESAFNRFNQRSSEASSHFGIKLDGEIEQYVDTADKSWHACLANHTGWIGNENESPGQDDPSTIQDELWDPLTQAQVVSNGLILRFLHEAHGVPIRVTDDINVGGVAYHSMNPGDCKVAWGRTGCPGPLIVEQRQAIVDVALGQEPNWASMNAAVTGVGEALHELHERAKEEEMRFGTCLLPNGKMVVVVRGPDDSINYKVQTKDGTWHPADWTVIPGRTRYTPELAVAADGGCMMFAVDTESNPLYAHMPPNTLKFGGFAPMMGRVAT